MVVLETVIIVPSFVALGLTYRQLQADDSAAGSVKVERNEGCAMARLILGAFAGVGPWQAVCVTVDVLTSVVIIVCSITVLVDFVVIVTVSVIVSACSSIFVPVIVV